MESNAPNAVRLLPDGRVQLVDGNGDPIRIRLAGTRGTFTDRLRMNLNKQADSHRQGKSRCEELLKPGLGEYRAIADRLLAPRFDVRTHQLLINDQPIDEEQFESMHLWLAEDHCYRMRKADLQAAVRWIASSRTFDPVASWLNGLATDPALALKDNEWRQVGNLALGIEGEFEGEMLRKWFIACAARALEPGCKVDYALVLYGRQGLGKSTFFKALAGEWFTDSMGDLSNEKDDLLKLHRSWICEWSEVDQVFQGAQKAERIKRFVSSVADDLRPPYGRTVQRFPRRSMLVGSTNRDDWATDPTGNRRFPVLAPTAVNLDWIRTNRERIWARAVAEFRKGTPWWFNQEQEAEISRRSADYAPEDLWQADLEAFFKSRDGEWFNTREIAELALALPAERIDKRVCRQIGQSMARVFALALKKERRSHTPRKASCGGQGTQTVYAVLQSKEQSAKVLET